MPIRYVNQKGWVFITTVTLRGDEYIKVYIQLSSTRSPALVKKKFMLPYKHDGIIPPFDFNNLEEGIRNILDIMYRDSWFDEFKQEDMAEIIDILMMHEAPVIDIRIFDEYGVCTNVCA
ncbi:beta c1 protein [Spinach yellow vein betasatellite]|uniref:Beta C1 protein n=1 Tax=Papaya leaf curl betasatellite TaxID=714640 RepID=E2FB15_9VIRU|nr:beta C1 protein [Papaya leaf curl betasatellite]AGZ80146.1 beta c1 protein [Spinach yellow vein betasatellite]